MNRFRKQIVGGVLVLGASLALAFWWTLREPAEGSVRVGEIQSDAFETVEDARLQPPTTVAPILPSSPQDSNPKVIVTAQRLTPDGRPFGRVQITDSSDHGWPVRIETVFPPGEDETSDAAVTTRMVADRFLIELAPDTDRRRTAEVLEKLGIMAQPIHRSAPILNARISDFEHADALPLSIEVARRALGSTAVTVEPDYLVQTHGLTPNDPSYRDQWALTSNLSDANIRAPDGWAIDNDADEITVAVIDSGIRLTHEDLQENLWVNPGEIPGNQIDDDSNGYVDDIHGIDSIKGTGDPSDTEGHGTHVAGIIGARGNNGIGISGVAWKVGLMPVRFLGSNGEGATSDAVISIEYAIENGADIINASWGGPGRSSVLESAIRRAGEAGILFVASAGNSGKDIDVSPVYPAGFDLPSLVAVASVEPDSRLSSFSNSGYQRVALAAPGSNIISCLAASDQAYGHASGTSMAAPHVTATAALLLSTFGSVQPEDLVDRLYRTARPVNSLSDKVASGGTLDLSRALSDTSSNPPNDDFGNAIEIIGSSFRYTGSTSFATGQPGEPDPFATAKAQSVWFVLTADYVAKVQLRVTSNQFESGVAVFRGTTLENLVQVTTQLGSDTDLTIETVKGTHNYIRIEPVDNKRGLYELAVEIPAPNDAFSQPVELSGESFTSVGDNRRATREPGEPDHGGHPANRSLWWSWTAPNSAYFVLSTFGSDHDTTLAVYEGDTLRYLSLIAENDNATDAVVFSSISFIPVSGHTYRIAADSTSPIGGAVNIQGTYDSDVRFIVQPEDQNTTPGADVVFTSRAQGPPPLSYQWFREDEPIPGATDAVLPLTSVSEADLGEYQVRARGHEADAFSRKARLIFGGRPPRILESPVGGHNYVGESIRLRTRVEGAAPLSIQWFHDGQPIAGAVRNSLVIPNSATTHTGNYFVRVSNAFGSNQSDPVRVVVTPPAHDGWHFRFTPPSQGHEPRLSFVNGRFYIDGGGYSSSDGAHWSSANYYAGIYVESGHPATVKAIAYGNGIYTSGSLSGYALEFMEPNPVGTIWEPTGLVYGNGIFVGIAYRTIIASDDGHIWSDDQLSPSYGFVDLVYGDSRFVAVGSSTIATSSDGYDWTEIEIPRSEGYGRVSFSGVTFGQGEFVASAYNGLLYRSTDGLNWTQFEHGFRGTVERPNDLAPLTDIAFGGDTFMAIGSDWIFSSTDLETWNRYPSPTPNLTSIVYGNGTFVAASIGNTTTVVQLGQTLDTEPLVAIEEPSAELVLAHGARQRFKVRASDPEGRLTVVRLLANGMEIGKSDTGLLEVEWTPPAAGSYTIVAQAEDANDMSASDAVRIQVRQPIAQPVSYPDRPVNPIDAVLFRNQYFVLDAEGNLWRSSDLQHWVVVYVPENEGTGKLLANNEILLVGNSPLLAVTRDGFSFVEVEAPGDDRSVDFLGSDGENGILVETEGHYLSFDGLNWREPTFDQYSLDLFAMSRGSVLALDDRGEFGWLQTADGATEAVHLPAVSSVVRSLFAHDGYFYLKGDTWIARSIDGRNWQLWDFGEDNYEGPEKAFTEGKVILLYGWKATPLLSTDLYTWQNLPIRNLTSVVGFKGNYYAATRDLVYWSTDLINWKVTHVLPQRGGSSSTESKLVVGPAGILLCADDGIGLGYSMDGVAWTQYHDPPTFISDHNVVTLAYGNGIWVASTYGAGLRIGTDLRNLELISPDLRNAFFDGARFIATSRSKTDVLYTSTDGRDWLRKTINVPENGSLWTLAHLKESGRYVIAINEHYFYTTADFIDWTYGEFRDRFSGGFHNVNGHVVFYTDGAFRHTTDGVNWHRVAFENQYGSLHWANGTYLVFINYDKVAVSKDLQQWEIHPQPDRMPRPQDLWVQPTDKGFFVSPRNDTSGEGSFFSPDGIHWEPTEPPVRYGAATYVNGKWYYLRRDVKVVVETDLELLSVIAPTGNYGADDTIELTLIIQNAAIESISLPEGLTVEGHLGNERTWNPRTETDLGSATTGSILLEPKESGAFKIHMTVPTEVSPGSHGLAVWIDSGNHVPERSEFNNYAWSNDTPIEIAVRMLRTTAIGGGAIEILPFRQRYAHNARVTLVPVEAPGYVFSDWEGVSESYQDTVTIRMNTDREVTARFSRVFTMVVEAEGEGDIVILPDEGVYPPGTEIEVSANPASGWVFRGWTGDQSREENELKFTIEGDTHIVARFHQTYANWKSHAFDDDQLADPAISGDLADPDGDGSINQAEFLFGTNALDPASLPWARVVRKDDRLAVRFPVRSYVDLASIGLETSSDISEWTSVIVTYSRIQTGSELDIVEAELIDPPDDTVFVRFVIRETTN